MVCYKKGENRKMKKGIIVALVLAIIGVLMIIAGVLVDFYQDYQCSTTTDIKWFVENNCMRYMK